MRTLFWQQTDNVAKFAELVYLFCKFFWFFFVVSSTIQNIEVAVLGIFKQLRTI